MEKTGCKKNNIKDQMKMKLTYLQHSKVKQPEVSSFINIV